MSATVLPTHRSLHELIDLTGKTAIVTGGAKGIGLGIAQRLHEAGASVVIADLDRAATLDAVRALDEVRPRGALGLEVDVGDQGSVDAMLEETIGRFGQLDVVVNNAGIFPLARLADLDLATFRHTLDVNLVGLFLCTKAAAARMIEQGHGGRIINITSIDALHPSMAGLAHYDASKHGAWGFTKNVAIELAAHGIAVNAIAPGGVLTPGVGDMAQDSLAAFEAVIPMRRMGVPDDIARVALFLASDLSSYMTGAQVVVDGGRLLA